MSEWYDQNPTPHEGALQSAEVISATTETLFAAQINERFVDLYAAAQSAGASDVITAANTIQTSIKSPVYSGAHFVNDLLVFGTLAELGQSAVLPMVYGLGRSAAVIHKAYRRGVNGEAAWNDRTKLLTEKSELLSEALGSNCYAWVNEHVGSIVLEVPNVDGPQALNLKQRLEYLEDVLTSHGIRDCLGGFIVSEELGSAMGLHERVATNKAIQSRAHKRVVMEGEANKMFVPTVISRASSPFDTEEQLVQMLKQRDPMHTLVRMHASGAKNGTLQAMARQLLEENLSDVHAVRDVAGYRTGKKDRSTVTLLGNAVHVTHPDGTIAMHAPSSLGLSLDSLGTMSRESEIRAIEYAIFKKTALPPIAKVAPSLTLEELEDQADIYHHINPIHNIVHIHTKQANGTKQTEKVSGFKDRFQTIRNGAGRAALTVLAGVTFLHVSSIEHTIEPANGFHATPVAGAEVNAVTHVQSGLNVIDEQIKQNIDRMSGDANSLESRAKNALNELGKNSHNALGSGFSSHSKNVPLWFISASPQTPISGYWQMSQYDKLGFNDANDSISWQQPTLKKIIHNSISSTDLAHIHSKNRMVDLANIVPPELQDSIIKVRGNVAFNPEWAFTDKSGELWQVINVPTLKGQQIVAADVNLVTFRNKDGYDSFGMPKVHILNADMGSFILVNIPPKNDPIMSPNRVKFMEVSYAQIAEPSRQNFYSIPVTYAPESGASEVAATITLDVKGYLNSLQYSLNPTSGKDTNNDHLYNLPDILNETMKAGQANCFTANSILAASNQSLTPFSGYLINEDEVAADRKNSDGVYATISSHDAHMYTVNTNGYVVDATPSTVDAKTKSYFEHKIQKGAFASPSIVDSAVKDEALQRKHQADLQLKGMMGLLGGFILLSVGAAGGNALLLNLRKRQAKKYLQETPSNIKASGLVQLAKYKLSDNPGAVITSTDMSHLIEMATPQHLTGNTPRQVKKVLLYNRELQQQKGFNPSYSLHDVRQATKFVKVARHVAKASQR